MSYNKLLGSESSFPVAMDDFNVKSGFTQNNINTYLSDIKRLNELKAKTSLTSTEQAEMMSLLDTLSVFMISSNDWNKLAGAVVNLQLALTMVESKYLEHIEKIITIAENTKTISFGKYTNDNGDELDIVLDNDYDLKITVSDNVPLIQDVDYVLNSDGKGITRTNNGDIERVFNASEDDPLELFIDIDRYITVDNNAEYNKMKYEELEDGTYNLVVNGLETQ